MTESNRGGNVTQCAFARSWIWLSAIAAVIVIQACAQKRTAVYDESEPVPTPPLMQGSESTQQAEVPAASVMALLAEAEADLDAGRLVESGATLERALRIAPKDPVLWQRLAEVRLQQGEAQQAEAMAKKSNSLVTFDTTLVYTNWQLIADARRLRGDEEGALRAERHAATHESPR